ncbi:MAG: arginine--tRNA ligase, partial [Phycisphaerae bacterium]|nr:arginine--tRNA ligase [Phycisphaerae bacterium]
MNLKAELERCITAALAACGAPAGSPAFIASPARDQFGDYQANGVMPAAKALGAKPADLAEKVLAQLGRGGAGDLSDLAEPPTVAGPGFINIRLKADWLARQLTAAAGDDHLGAERAGNKNRQTVVVDYSGPNLAKEMHVGHLRSTIIGDALARTLDFLGHRVIRQNHVGDWGTQFGMLVANMPRGADLWDLRVRDQEGYYVDAQLRFDSDPEFADRARANVVELHRAGPNAWKTSDAVLRWQNLRGAMLEHCYAVYGRLGVWFTPEEYRSKLQPDGPGQVPPGLAPAEQTGIVGESFYNDDLPKVVKELDKQGLLKESQGAQCVFLPEFKDKEGNELPVIVQKTDEGYLYATTDLAAIRYRVRELAADRVLYVTDSRQALHFRQVFAVARAAKFAPESVSLEHVAFGMMLGADGKPFRTREGGTVKLMDLLDEAERR